MGSFWSLWMKSNIMELLKFQVPGLIRFFQHFDSRPFSSDKDDWFLSKEHNCSPSTGSSKDQIESQGFWESTDRKKSFAKLDLKSYLLSYFDFEDNFSLWLRLTRGLKPWVMPTNVLLSWNSKELKHPGVSRFYLISTINGKTQFGQIPEYRKG